MKTERQQVVLVIAETAYKLTLKAELNDADPEIRARVMMTSEGVVDALTEQGLLAFDADEDLC